MQGVYRHKPMSSIIAPSADEAGEKKAQTPEGAADNDLPEKYRGKSAREIAEMHMNAEKRLGQLQNETGQLRGLVQDLAQVQRQSTPVTPEPEVPVDVSGDDLISNPADTIRRVVQPLINQSKPKEPEELDKSDQALYSMEQNALLSDFGDPREIVSTQEFQDFVERTPSRQADFQRACDPNEGIEQLRAARRLLEDFTDFTSSMPASEASQRRTAIDSAKRIANEGSGPAGPVSTREPIYEADVIAMINSNPSKYRSPSFQKELHDAIREGRYIKHG